MIVNPENLQSSHPWRRQYYSDLELVEWRIKQNKTLFVLPFPVSGNYIDQAGSALLFLGDPFFFHHEPNRIAQTHAHYVQHRSCLLTYQKLHLLRCNKNKTWLDTEHVHLLVSWFFRDGDHPILNQFHVVPMDITRSLRSYFDFDLDSETMGRTLHNYCSKNYKSLHRRFIVYV